MLRNARRTGATEGSWSIIAWAPQLHAHDPDPPLPLDPIVEVRARPTAAASSLGAAVLTFAVQLVADPVAASSSASPAALQVLVPLQASPIAAASSLGAVELELVELNAAAAHTLRVPGRRYQLAAAVRSFSLRVPGRAYVREVAA